MSDSILHDLQLLYLWPKTSISWSQGRDSSRQSVQSEASRTFEPLNIFCLWGQLDGVDTPSSRNSRDSCPQAPITRQLESRKGD